MTTRLTKTAIPDAGGHYGAFGGRYVAETLMPAILELEAAKGVKDLNLMRMFVEGVKSGDSSR
jgi:tryptophan synthase beta subunit